MNVAFLIGHLNRGGAETLLLDVFKRWQEVPFGLTLIHRHGGAYEEEFRALANSEKGPRIFLLRPTKARVIHYLYQLHKLFKKQHIDVIHAQSWLDCIYGKIASIGLPMRVVLTMHGYYGAECKWMSAIRYKVAFLCADAICFVSQYQQNQYYNRYRIFVQHKSRIVYNGVDIQKFPSIKEEVHSCPQLCMVGNFNEVRSQLIVIEAIKILKEMGIADFSFSFIGSRYKGQEYLFDECVNYCETHNLQNVHFLGARDDVPQLLKEMDGFVYSSQNDTFGIAVVEAMLIGLPVIVNDMPVMKEITNDGIFATLFESNNAEDCATKIRDLLADLQVRKRQAMRFIPVVISKYSIEEHIRRLYEIYQD